MEDLIAKLTARRDAQRKAFLGVSREDPGLFWKRGSAEEMNSCLRMLMLHSLSRVGPTQTIGVDLLQGLPLNNFFGGVLGPRVLDPVLVFLVLGRLEP